MRGTWVVVIEESSVTTLRTIVASDQRLRAAWERDEPFGGVSIIMMGDPMQLGAIPSPKMAAQTTDADGRPTWHPNG